jgi:cellulose 1,4-beta-cellobiosidase
VSKHRLRRRLGAAATGLALLAPLAATTGTAQAQTARPANPFAGATSYVNPDYAALVETSIARTRNETLRARMARVGTFPTAVWLDRIAAIGGGDANAGRRSLADHLDTALEQQRAGTPITVTIVVYNLPGRDCAALASNGELPLSAEGFERYQREYIDVIAEVVGDPRYRDVRVATVIEPDGLPNLVTNLNDPQCAAAQSTGRYAGGVRYAVERLGALPNVWNYLDIGHSGWLGWDDNRSRTVRLYTEVIRGSDGGFANVAGFVTNTSNYTPFDEPHLEADTSIGGQPVRSSAFYEWNPSIDEATFTAALHRDFRAAGWPATSTGFLVDTSRNGWGNAATRPTGPSASQDLNTHVDQSRIDRRRHRGLWCNVARAGLGAPPQANPAGAGEHVHAFVWVKPPGESDGASREIPNDEGKRADPNCDPTHTTGYGVPTGALPDAPLAGHWFHYQFAMLVNNAHPAIAS